MLRFASYWLRRLRPCFLLASVRRRRAPVEPNQSPGGGGSHVKRSEMLVVSLRSDNHGFWSHLGCTARIANIFSCQDSLLGCTGLACRTGGLAGKRAKRIHKRGFFSSRASRSALVYRVSLTAPLIRLFCRLHWIKAGVNIKAIFLLGIMV